MSALRVAVVTGRIAGLDPVQAGAALGRGLAGRAEVAVVPVADGGPDLAVAVAALWGTEPGLDDDRWVVRTPGRVLLGLRQPDAPAWAPGNTTTDLGEWVAA
ncbi:MAG: hypothetical protein KDB60_13090, partial [Propionibacteriaceae bacterium]|nr:hypothetical protein [Propionibacteriaceae bacterium]